MWDLQLLDIGFEVDSKTVVDIYSKKDIVSDLGAIINDL